MSRLGDTWTGVPIKEILDRVKPKPEAKYVMAHCEYGYTTSVPSRCSERRETFSARVNGKDLTPTTAGRCACRAIEILLEVGQVVRGLEFMERNGLVLEQRGYHDEADPWKETRYW